MTVNTTDLLRNITSSYPDRSSDIGLIVGLTLFFAFFVLIIVAGILSYKYFDRLREIFRLDSRKSTEKEDEVCGEAPRTVQESHDYSSKPEGNTQAPIYENITRITQGYNKNMYNRSTCEPEDDGVYLQCDAIYSNDPACNPHVHDQGDDTYIIPDSEDF